MFSGAGGICRVWRQRTGSICVSMARMGARSRRNLCPCQRHCGRPKAQSLRAMSHIWMNWQRFIALRKKAPLRNYFNYGADKFIEFVIAEVLEKLIPLDWAGGIRRRYRRHTCRADVFGSIQITQGGIQPGR